MAAYSDEDQAQVVADEESSGDSAGPYAIGSLSIDFNDNEPTEDANSGVNADEYAEMGEGESVEQLTKSKKKKETEVDPNNAAPVGAYKDVYLDAAYVSPETDGLAEGYE